MPKSKFKHSPYEISTDLDHQFITEFEREYWNNKSDFDHEHPELVDARGSYDTLKDRLCSIDKSLDSMKITSIEDYPRLPGETSDDPRISRAFRNLSTNSTIYFPKQEYLLMSDVILPNISCEIKGEFGTRFICSSGSLVIVNHKYIKVSNCEFSGSVPGLKFLCSKSLDLYKDFTIESCRFIMRTEVYGIHLYFAGEGEISGCYFQSGNGIYRRNTINTTVSNCIFKYGGIGIFDEGDNTNNNQAYTCGLMCNQLTMLGMNIGLKLVEGDHFSIINSMIDYCDNPVQIYGMYGGNISDSYFSSRTENPSILIDKGLVNNDHSKEIFIRNSHILGHYTNRGFSCIDIRHSNNIVIESNNITFYQDYGIVYSDCTILTITNNYIAPRGSSGISSVKCSGSDDSSNIIRGGRFNQLPDVKYAKLYDISGVPLSSSTEVVIPENTPFVIIDLPRALYRSPSIHDVTIVPLSNPSGSTAYCTYTSKTQVTVTLSAPVSTRTKWLVRVLIS